MYRVLRVRVRSSFLIEIKLFYYTVHASVVVNRRHSIDGARAKLLWVKQQVEQGQEWFMVKFFNVI